MPRPDDLTSDLRHLIAEFAPRLRHFGFLVRDITGDGAVLAEDRERMESILAALPQCHSLRSLCSLRCSCQASRLGRDGRKLELWAMWLGLPEGETLSRKAQRNPSLNLPRARGEPEKPTEKRKPSTDSEESEAGRLAADTGVSPSKASAEHIATVIREHGSDILGLFVYPDSRATLLQYLGRAGLLQEFRRGLGVSESVRALDFWSYTQDLDRASRPPSIS
ncbi:hypothetical protein NUW54_g13816 [Trametes sanguinea]|uniref:Uncharacterized protein n=1 Tax=Trametes sanguinea TaxID=158606 RepID=A0ACC1MHB2_9APHY|nr:hypothetical protein NUW54_g13816 [Trametes sanguinea]